MIKIYTKSDCVFCRRAKNLMDSRKIDYVEARLGEDYEKDFLRTAYPTMMTFPVIVLDNVLVGGYIELVERVGEDPNFGKKVIQE